ncbi:LOW QUALITY PROTEIN: segment polarity protein dishevelled homolog DVL-3 [Sarcophilus harrisii]
MGETKIIYHLDGQETPYLQLPLPAERVTRPTQGRLQRPTYKFFFKSMDDDFGLKEEISDDNARLPCFNGRVVSWSVSAEGSHPEPSPAPTIPGAAAPKERTGGIGDSRPPSFHPHTGGGAENLDNDTETDSLVSAQQERPRRRDGPEHVARMNGTAKGERRREAGGYDSSSTLLMSSELETTSFFDSDEDDSTSRFSSSTEQSSASRLMRRHKRRRRKQKVARIERVRGSRQPFSSITDSTMSLKHHHRHSQHGTPALCPLGCRSPGAPILWEATAVISFCPVLSPPPTPIEKYNFLGISIVGQSNGERGDGGIYIGSIMKGGVAADGRIEPGTCLLPQVNDINFENMSKRRMARVLREIVHKPGLTLTVAKCWDPSPRGCFTLPRSEPIRPIDPAAWVSHTAAMTGTFPAYGMSPSLSTITSTSSSIARPIPDTGSASMHFHLSIHSDMATIVKAMASPESGLEVRDRMWLKITIPTAFIGSDVVDWLYHNVEVHDRREARKYASNLLKAGFIRHTANKITFSEQCYYIFGDLCGSTMANLSLHDQDGSSGADQDTLAPLPHPRAAPWPMAFPYQYPPPTHPYNPHPGFPEPGYSYAGGSAGSQHSEGSRSSGSNRSGSDRRKEKDLKAGDSKSGGSGSESDHTSRSSLTERAPSERSGPAASEHSVRSHPLAHSLRSHHTHQSYGPSGVPPLSGSTMLMMPPPLAAMGPGAPPPGRDRASVPPELTASRQSFRMAKGNPSEFFVDVM